MKLHVRIRGNAIESLLGTGLPLVFAILCGLGLWALYQAAHYLSDRPLSQEQITAKKQVVDSERYNKIQNIREEQFRRAARE